MSVYFVPDEDQRIVESARTDNTNCKQFLDSLKPNYSFI